MKGFDVNQRLSYEQALAFKKLGYEFVMRYVGRLQKSPSIDIDKVETDNILKAGLSLGIVQHCPPKPGLIPLKLTAVEYGRNAVTFAKEAGYKQDCIIYLDLEDVNIAYKDKQPFIIDFCNTWYDEVKKAGYVPGVYVGFNCFLSGDELYNKLKFTHYWKSFSQVPDVTRRSYSMWQDKQTVVNGITIDPDEAMLDKLGGFPNLMTPEKTVKYILTIFSDGTFITETM